MSKRICVVTGSRAEFGLLEPVIRELLKRNFDVQILATGSHYLREQGSTISEIESLGYDVAVSIPMSPKDDSREAVVVSMGEQLIALPHKLTALSPDAILILGDRYEIATVAISAVILQIPLIHLGGGDQSLGSYDDSLRHMISKASHLHLVSNEMSRLRVIQMGERAENVVNTGSTIIDNIRSLQLPNKTVLKKVLGVNLQEPVVTVTLHPATNSLTANSSEMNEMIQALRVFNERHKGTIVITGSNADNGGAELNVLARSFADGTDGVTFHQSLGRINYLGLLAQSDICLGNSSSGIIEAPYLRVPTVNIGNRQEGRSAPKSVVSVHGNFDAILAGLENALLYEDWDIEMVYGETPAAPRMADAIEFWLSSGVTTSKDFQLLDQLHRAKNLSRS